MVMEYKIAFVKIKIDSSSEIDLAKLNKFISKPYQSGYVNINIKRVEKINVGYIESFRHKCFSAVDFGNGKCGYILYSVDGTPNALVMSEKSWENIDILYAENIKIENRSIVDYALRVAFNNIVIANKGLIVHSSAIHYQNKGLIFSAPSGTGKSTHTKFWRENLGAGIINDDLPALMPMDNKRIMVCGTPWSGSTDLFSNLCVPLDAIIVISRHHINEIYQMSISEIIHALFPRCLFPYHSPLLLDTAFDTFKKIIGSVPVYHLKCTPTLEAAKMVKSFLKL